jgi:hypothetical protein
MPYQLLNIEKEAAVIDGRTEDIYVAVVQKDGEEQPFRVALENGFETKEEALSQVNKWIANMEADDALRAANAEKDAATAVKDSIMDEINQK